MTDDPEVTASADHDSGYVPFPSFQQFAASVQVSTGAWDEYTKSLQTKSSTSSALLDRAREIAVRAAAVDTGAIENLYETDRGFTYTIATEAAMWEAAAANKGEHVRNLIAAQLLAYDYIIDLATALSPMSEMSIRELHEIICNAQETYIVQTPSGQQEQLLPKGRYKSAPNHVVRMDGLVHAYAPVSMTAPEMSRLVGELSSKEFQNAHPILQTAYAHFSFVAVHPFADGNGRVARALASVYYYRASSVPLLIMVDQRSRYFDALSASDAGSFQPFVDFIGARGVDALLLVLENLRTAAAPDTAAAASRLARLFLAREGLTHSELDQAGIELLDAFFGILHAILSPMTSEHFQIQALDTADAAPDGMPDEFRVPVGRPRAVRIDIASPKPAQARVVRGYHIGVPKAGTHNNVFLLWCPQNGDQIRVPIADVSPSLSSSAHIRLTMTAERIVGEAVSELSEGAERALRQSGY